MNERGLGRIGMLVIAIASLTPSVGLAVLPYTPPPNLSETPEAQARRLSELAQVPLVQVEVEFGIDQRFSDTLSWTGHCYFEVVVRRSFQHASILPVGRRVRVRSDCKKEGQSHVVEISPGINVDLLSGPNERDLVRGSLLQLRLLPAYGPIDGFEKIGPVTVLHALSPAPVDDSAGEKHRASFLNDYALLERDGPSGAGFPPQFPLTDVVVTYKEASHPTRAVRVVFQGRTWRMRSEEIGDRDVDKAIVIADAFAQTETWIWDKTATYAIQQTDWRTRYGKVVGYWQPIFQSKGTDIIAGFACTEYHVRSDLPTLEPAEVCMTSDGVVLRRSYPDGNRLEASAVAYAPVSREKVTVPVTYRKTDSVMPTQSR